VWHDRRGTDAAARAFLLLLVHESEVARALGMYVSIGPLDSGVAVQLPRADPAARSGEV
jgi:hypothetical protein